MPLEYNLDGLKAISFSKGCYVGQELVARTHFQGMVRKRLMPIAVGDAAAGEPSIFTLHAFACILQLKPCYVVLLLRLSMQQRMREVCWVLFAGGVKAGMSVYAEGLARAAGKVVAVDGQAGMAVIRLEAAFGPEQSALHVGQQDGPRINAHRPSWWPQQWGQEQEQR